MLTQRILIIIITQLVGDMTKKSLNESKRCSVLDSSPICTRIFIEYSPLRNENFTDFPGWINLVMFFHFAFFFSSVFCITRFRNVLYTPRLIDYNKEQKNVVLQLKENVPVILTRFTYFFLLLCFRDRLCCVPWNFTWILKWKILALCLHRYWYIKGKKMYSTISIIIVQWAMSSWLQFNNFHSTCTFVEVVWTTGCIFFKQNCKSIN